MKIEIHNMYKKYQVDYFRSKQIFSDYSLKLDSEKINFIVSEPTASLDADNARIIMRELRQINTENNSMVVVATHDNRILSPKDNILSLESDVNIR